MRRAPWHVKGVAPAAQESAQEAARRSGLSVGEWLNHVIAEQADADDDSDSHHTRDDERDYQRERLAERGILTEKVAEAGSDRAIGAFRFRAGAPGIGARASLSPCWMSVGAFALLM